MKTLEVSSLLNGIDAVVRQIESQKAQLKELERAVASFTDLGDSFTGEGGDAIRRFYREWHLPLIAYRSLTLEKYQGLLENLKQATSALEPSHDGYILESFLEGPLMNGVTRAESVTVALVDEGNSYMDAVSDIISLPRLKDHAFREGVRDAKRHIRQTIQDLNTYDYSQTGELSALDADLDLMDGYLKDLSGIFGNPSFRIETYDLQLQDFSGYQKLRVNLAMERFKEFSVGFSMFFSSFWAIFGPHLIQSGKSDEYVYEMLRGYERRYEELERITNMNKESVGEEMNRGPHRVERGKPIDLAAIDALEGVSVETFNLRGVPLHYSVIDGKLIIYRENPNLWYSTQNATYTAMSEIFGTVTKSGATAMGDYYLGKGAARLPGAGKINTELDKLPEIPGSGGTKVGDIGKEQLSETIQGKIPLWGEIISADVPKAGTKEVIVYLDDNGDQYNRRVKFTLGNDGVLSIDDWYTGELNTVKQKEKEEVNFSDVYNWMTNHTDPNNSTTVSQEAKKAVENYGLKDSKDHSMTPGTGLNLNELEYVEDIHIHTTTIEDVPINYSIVGGDIVVFPDNPDIHYSQQTVEYGKGTEILSQYAQKTLTTIADNQIEGLIGKIPGVDTKLDSLPNIYNTDVGSGELIKGTVTGMAHNHIPGWEKVASAPVPASGEKQVLLQISKDGETVSGVKLFRLKEDGTVTMY